MGAAKYLVTQSLLGALDRAYVYGDFDSFLKSLRKEETPPSVPMLNGIQFEKMVYEFANTGQVLQKDWTHGIMAIGDRLKGAQFQVRLSKELTVDGMDFVLYGVLDALKAGTIYDVKFTQSYEKPRYFTSMQHPAYLELCPEADKFTYLISDGNLIWEETYTAVGTQPIKYAIGDLIRFLTEHDLMEEYKKYWEGK